MGYEVLFYTPWAGLSGFACYLYLYRAKMEAEAWPVLGRVRVAQCVLSAVMDIALGAFAGTVVVILVRALAGADIDNDMLLMAAIAGGYANRSFPSIIEMWIKRLWDHK